MTTILLNALSIMLVLFLALLLKKIGILHQKDGALTSKMVVYLTLPATILIGVNHTKLSNIFFILMFMGLFSNLLLVFLGKLIGRKATVEERGLYMFDLSGYNIGNFSIPFVSSFFPAAIPFLAMFDMGNSLMVTGTTQAIVELSSGRKKHGFILQEIFGVLFRNPPFVVYIFMFILAIFGLSFPDGWLIPIRPLANANTLLSIFTIGLFMEFRLPKGKLKLVIKILTWRYLLAFILASLVYFFLPFPAIIKEILLLIFFCPMSFLHMIQAIELGNDKALAGLTISLSMFISLILMSIIVIIL
ncbi:MULTISPECIES: AEC family transporter [Lactococcus]|uniref:AEC family transporter n=1 Tax=Lactococcus TaxID=1357 RepID=UPI001CDBEB24|nr:MULTISPECIES: AEC family transporter [Lactococcus]MCA2390844.1 AEC family transporter [Lactococcus sp. NH2-7C]MCI1072141.1 AEC family transporter [Lactococcus lactis]WGV31422.1 AEC family transporter [Lactococcus sp. NH2-7C]